MTTPTIEITQHFDSRPGWLWTWSVQRDGQVLDAALDGNTYYQASAARVDAAKALFKLIRAEYLEYGASLSYDTYAPAPGETGIVLYANGVEVAHEEGFDDSRRAIGRGLPDLLEIWETQTND